MSLTLVAVLAHGLADFSSPAFLDVLGIDGAYVDPEMLLIPAGHFLVKDLLHPIQTDKRYDLAVCLEVAEHLPGTRSAGLVQDLDSLAPCVLFSAALPGQGGTDHVNERYLSYRVGLFSEHNYLPFDLLGPRIWNDASIEWWYPTKHSHFCASRTSPRGLPKRCAGPAP